jgi:hypothetical protein
MGSAAQPRRQEQNENDEERSDGPTDSEELRRAEKDPLFPNNQSSSLYTLQCYHAGILQRLLEIMGPKVMVRTCWRTMGTKALVVGERARKRNDVQ